MFECDLRRYVAPLRWTGIAAIALALVIGAYSYSIAEGPLNRFWNIMPLFAGFASLGFLILAAADKVKGERPLFTGISLIVIAAAALLLLAGYFLWAGLRSRDPDWVVALNVVISGGFTWLLLLFGILRHDARAGSYGILLGSAIIVCGLAFGLYRADHAFIYPAHSFLQPAIPPVITGLVLIVVSSRRWEAAKAPSSTLFTAIFAALGLIYVADMIWWTQPDMFRVQPEIAARQIASIAASVLVAFVVVGRARPREAAAALAAIVLLTVASTIATLDNVSQHHVLFFVTNSFQPIALSVFALALAIAFESNRGEEIEVDDPDLEGDFGPPLPAWRET
jgi:hypothetical protein